MSIHDDLAELLGPEAPKLEVVREDHPVPPMHMQWLKFRDQFVEAMEGSYYAIEDLERDIGRGAVLFFPGKNSAIVGKKEQYGQTQVFQVTWAVGDADEIVSLAPGIEAMARILGCSEVLVEGRKGWERALKSSGYGFFSTTLRKAV